MTVLLRLPLLALTGILALPHAMAQGQVPGSPVENAQFGRALTAGDFNGDGVEDLAIGAPFDDVGTLDGAGSVTVLYGTDQYRYSFAMGLRPDGAQIWTRESPGILGDARAGDWFGYALTAGDFNGDTFDDLAIGIHRATVGGLAQAGAVSVLYGSANGLTAAGNQVWDQNSPDIGGGAEIGDGFGYALATGDFDRDGHDDLVVGVPFEDIGSVNDAGAAQVIFGAADGLVAAGNQFFDQSNAGVPGAAEAGDTFGFSFGVGDFNGDTTDDLAIGTPLEDVGSIVNAGAVYVLFGTVTVGIELAGAQSWDQGAVSSNPLPDTGDRFGYALAVGNFNQDPFDDLVVTSPFQDWTTGAGDTYTDTGYLHAIKGSASGLTRADSEGSLLLQDDGRYGTDVAVGNPRGSDPYLIAGQPGRNVSSQGEAGRILIRYTDDTGLTDTALQYYTQNNSGIEDISEAEDAYGFVVATGDFNGDGLDDIAIGVPGEDVDGATDAGGVNIMYALPSGRMSADYDLFLHPGSSFAAPVASEDEASDLASSLLPPAPNPTTGRTTLRYALAEAQDVQLVVMDLLGREVARLADGPHQAGDHEAAFAATALPSGVYIVHLRAGETVHTKRLTVTR
ncbi:MAG: T9SS type A sorting domain-containing protein [Bacteroidota bacterium]